MAKQVLLGYKPLPALIAEKLPRWCPGGDVLSLGRAPGSQDMHRAPGTQAIFFTSLIMFFRHGLPGVSKPLL